MAAKLRAGLIGCGFYAQNHLHAWRDLGAEVELAAVCDVDLDKAGAAAAKFAVPKAYGDARQMLETERLDFVDIVTTMPSHRALVLLAAAHKTPTIVQKPFAPTWADCIEMVEACEKAGVKLMVH
jgi:D-apiose dehydrogenase